VKYDAERQMWIAGPCELPVKVFRSDDYTFPSGTFSRAGERELTQCTRQVIVEFENRWGLSIIWGSMTYGDNYDHPHGSFCRGTEFPDFVDEPLTVEVGIFCPVPKTFPAKSYGPLPFTKQTVEMPERTTSLWGDPLAYVDAEALCVAVIPRVSSFDSDGLPWPEEGPEIEEIDGQPTLVWLPAVVETDARGQGT